MKETIIKMNKTESWFFEKINRTDKPLARFIKTEREKNQINNIRNEKGEVTTDNAEISAVPGILQARTLEWAAISFSITFYFKKIQNIVFQKANWASIIRIKQRYAENYKFCW